MFGCPYLFRLIVDKLPIRTPIDGVLSDVTPEVGWNYVDAALVTDVPTDDRGTNNNNNNNNKNNKERRDETSPRTLTYLWSMTR